MTNQLQQEPNYFELAKEIALAHMLHMKMARTAEKPYFCHTCERAVSPTEAYVHNHIGHELEDYRGNVGPMVEPISLPRVIR